MDQAENYFLSHNKLLEDKIDYCLHNIEARIDKLYERNFSLVSNSQIDSGKSINKAASPYSASNFLHFKAPYIKDFRDFSGPTNDDVKQIRELTGTENIDFLIKNKTWSKESRQQLCDAVKDHYAQIHIIELIKQKNYLINQREEDSALNRADFEQKLNLIEEQTEQVKSRKEQRIFVPENRYDPNIDWCSISAKLSNTHHDAQDCRLMWTNNIHWTVNKGLWTKEEDLCLLNAVQKFGKNDWDAVAKELNSNRLPWQCCSRYHQELNSYCGVTPISQDDTDKIIEVINLCRIGNFVPWNQVMYFIQYHSLLQVKYQWQKLLSEKQSNRAWSHQEDVLLLRATEKFGDKDWNRISNYIPGRSNKSCRERYTMRLKFRRRSIGNWRRKEDETLLYYVERFGTNWSLISKHFPERNNHQIRSRYELLRNEVVKVGPFKHKRLYRDSEGHLLKQNTRRQKVQSDIEVDRKLQQIFSTYHNIQSTSKSLVCRSLQDELIHQTLFRVMHEAITGKESKNDTLLNSIILKGVKENITSRNELFSPCLPTIRGFRAWTLLQEFLRKFEDHPIDLTDYVITPEYNQLLKIVMSLFTWPAILSRLKAPNCSVTTSEFQIGSIIEKDSKNLYKVREIQKRIIQNE